MLDELTQIENELDVVLPQYHLQETMLEQLNETPIHEVALRDQVFNQAKQVDEGLSQVEEDLNQIQEEL